MATKLKVKLGGGHTASEHEIEIDADLDGAEAGETECRLNGRDFLRADWARISPGVYSILIAGRSYEARVSLAPGGTGAQDYAVQVDREIYHVKLHDPRCWQRRGTLTGSEGLQDVRAPMPGKMVKALVGEGDDVEEGQGLLVIEAMKMQNEMRSPRAGRVERIYVAEGEGVEMGAPLVRLASL
jgi:biotin carboxyl carrier protein